MIYPENPNFEDEFEAEIQTKNARFNQLKNLLSADNKFKARLASQNLQTAPIGTPTNISAGLGLIGKDLTETDPNQITYVDPRLLDDISRQIQDENKTLWDNVTDKLKGVTRGVFIAADAGLDFVKGQLLGRFPVAIGQKYQDKLNEGLTRTQALSAVFDEFDDIRAKVGDTAFTMALREAVQGRQINLGEGIIPMSTPVKESDEYKELIARGIAPETALNLAEKMIGAPITEIAREQAISGVQFRGETGAGLEAEGYGKEITLGRLLLEPFVAMDVIEPGSNGYRNISGAADFVGTLALDPANWIAIGAGSLAKGAKSIKYADEVQKAQQIAEMGGLTGGIRKTVLNKFPRLGGFSVDGFLSSKKGQNLIDFLSASDDITTPAGDIDYLSSLLKTDDFDTLGKIARTTDKSDMNLILNEHFGTQIGERIPFATRLFDNYKLEKGAKLSQNIFSKITNTPTELTQFGIGPALRHTNKWSPTVRLFSKLYEGGYDTNDFNRSFVTLKNMMRQMDLPAEDRARILKEYVDDIAQIVPPGKEIVPLKPPTFAEEIARVAEAQIVQPLTQSENANIIFKANASAVRAWGKKLTKEVGDDEELANLVVNKITKIYDRDLGEAGLQFVDEQGNAFNLGETFKAYVNNEIVDIPSFRLETELAQNYIPTIQPSVVAKATNILKKNILGRQPLNKFKNKTDLSDDALELMMDKYISGVWKPAVLLRGAWTIRVIGEEQVRLWAAGYDGLFSPRRWLAFMMQKDLDPTGTLKILKRIEDGVSDTKIENLIFEEFPDLPKRFQFNGEQIGIVEAIKRYMNTGNRDLLEIVNLTSKETEVMREFFDAISGTHRGYAGLRKSNPNLASKGFSVFYKSDKGKGYVNALQTEYDQLMNDTLAVKILQDGVDAAKEFLWKTRFDENSLAKQISKQDPFFEQILSRQEFSNNIVDFINARIHIKTGGQVDKNTLQILKQGNEELLQILRTGSFDGANIKSLGTTKTARKQYTKIYNKYINELPSALKGRGGTQYGEFAFQSKFGQAYDQVVENMFYALMTFPTNKLSRGPVFKQAYWKKVASFISVSDADTKAGIIARAKQANVSSSLIKQMEKTAPTSYANATFRYGGKATDEGWRTFSKAFDAIDESAKAHALTETKKLLYDLSERTRFWEAT